MSIVPIHIRTWAEVSAGTKWHGLLVGNGGSIALHPAFDYASLHAAAVHAGRLPKTQNLFAALPGGTTNFESVMLALSHATTVGLVLGTPTAPATDAYDEVRRALIETIETVHCTHAEVQDDLAKIAFFSKQFETVVTFNYDLTLYWAMLEANDLHGQWFKDGFVDERAFKHVGWQTLRRPYGTEGTTLVFFAHGSLILGRDPSGRESKVVTGSSPNLFCAIAANWKNGGVTPLFVSEGTAAEKRAAIRRSRYLSVVYDDVLTDFEGRNVVVYGLSFAANDVHLLEALAKAPPAQLAVSVHCAQEGSAQVFCHQVLADVRQVLPDLNVSFFDAASPDCWNN